MKPESPCWWLQQQQQQQLLPCCSCICISLNHLPLPLALHHSLSLFLLSVCFDCCDTGAKRFGIKIYVEPKTLNFLIDFVSPTEGPLIHPLSRSLSFCFSFPLPSTKSLPLLLMCLSFYLCANVVVN